VPVTSSAKTAAVLRAILPIYLVAIGACRFATIDPEAERTDLQEVCTVQGKWLSGIGPGNHAFPGPARFALLHDSRQAYWILDAQDCALREVKLPSPQPGEINTPLEVTNDDALLYVVLSHSAVPVRYGRLDLSTGREISGAMPQPREAVPTSPRFSREGRWGAWIAQRSDASDTLRDTVHVGALDRLDSGSVFTPAERLRVDSYAVIDVAPGGEAVLLEPSRGGYLLVDSSGALIRAFSLDGGVRPFFDSVRFSEHGGEYLAWDGYRDGGRYVVQWRINGQLVRKELAQHSSISDGAVSSDWNWIAVSSSANTRGGGGIESVTLWFRDGATRYHKRLRKATRAPVVFLGDDLFAYPEMDEKGQATTRVFRLPATGER
jgi:hypothetical protein